MGRLQPEDLSCTEYIGRGTAEAACGRGSLDQLYIQYSSGPRVVTYVLPHPRWFVDRQVCLTHGLPHPRWFAHRHLSVARFVSRVHLLDGDFLPVRWLTA